MAFLTVTLNLSWGALAQGNGLFLLLLLWFYLGGSPYGDTDEKDMQMWFLSGPLIDDDDIEIDIEEIEEIISEGVEDLKISSILNDSFVYFFWI